MRVTHFIDRPVRNAWSRVVVLWHENDQVHISFLGKDVNRVYDLAMVEEMVKKNELIALSQPIDLEEAKVPWISPDGTYYFASPENPEEDVTRVKFHEPL